MDNNQLTAIVAAILFQIGDKNPPHGIYESREEASVRAIAKAKTLLRAVERS